MEAFLSGNPLNRRQVAEGIMALNEKIFKAEPPKNTKDFWVEHLIIRRILEIATKEQKKFGDEELLDHPRTDEDLKAFLDWSDQQGIFHDAVDVIRCTEVDGFCLKVNKPIKKGDTLVTVPRHAMLTSDNAFRDLAMFFHEKGVEMWNMDNFAVALFFLGQKFAHRSHWEPYIKMFPTKFDLPIFYSVEQLESLKHSALFETILSFYRSCAHMFCAIFQEVYELHKYNKKKNKAYEDTPLLLRMPLTMYNFNFDTWRWAVACMSTRVALPTNTEDTCFIPLMDFTSRLFIPDFIEETSAENGEKKQYTQLTAHRDFEVGEMDPIFDNCSANLIHLLRTGSVPDKNPHDRYCLTLPIPRSDKYHEQKTRYYESLGYTGRSAYNFAVGKQDSPIPQNLLAVAKIIVSEYPHVDDYDSTEVQLKAVKYLKNRFKLLRSTYKIKTGTNDFEKMVERLQRSEVDILQNAEEFCANWEQELLDEAESRAATAEIADDNAPAAGAVEAEAPAAEAFDTDASDAGVAATEPVDASSK